MANAMISSILKSKIYNNKQITVSDKNYNKNTFLQQKWNIKADSNNYNAAFNSDIIILAVKPQSLNTVLSNLSGIENKIFISVIAGIPLQKYKDNLKNNKIVKSNANTPCMIQKGMSTWITYDLDNNEKNIVKEILQSFRKRNSC